MTGALSPIEQVNSDRRMSISLNRKFNILKEAFWSSRERGAMSGEDSEWQMGMGLNEGGMKEDKVPLNQNDSVEGDLFIFHPIHHPIITQFSQPPQFP